MEGPTSSWGSKNRITCRTLQEHDDDDDDDDDDIKKSFRFSRFPSASCRPSKTNVNCAQSSGSGWVSRQFWWTLKAVLCILHTYGVSQAVSASVIREHYYVWLDLLKPTEQAVCYYTCSYNFRQVPFTLRIPAVNTEWPKKMYTLFAHRYLWNKFKWNLYFRVRV